MPTGSRKSAHRGRGWRRIGRGFSRIRSSRGPWTRADPIGIFSRWERPAATEGLRIGRETALISRMPRPTHLRDADARADHSVSPLELFFDLVFVFAVTQLSHYLLEHHTLAGALQTLVMFLALWWAWIFTAWATNWLHPDRTPVRIALLIVMLLSMVLSTAIPGAFGPYGLLFALAYIAIQVGRTAYTAWAREGLFSGSSTNMARATIY